MLSFCLDIANGMDFLTRECGIIHRDLKSLNVLMFSTPSFPRCKICDFGLSREGSTTMQVTFAGSVCWTPPEFLKAHTVSHKTDVYSFGIVAWEIITRCMPYNGMMHICVRHIM